MRLPLRYSLRSLLTRRTRTTLTAMGVGVAVFASTSMVGLSRGLLASNAVTGSSRNVIVLGRGAESMEFSAVEPDVVQRLRAASQVELASDGEPLASPEAFLAALVQVGESAATERRAVVRGVRPIALGVHEQVRVVEGSGPTRGGGITVGRLAATKLGVRPEALAIGRELDFEGARWHVVGMFEAPGSVLESEVWADLDDVLVATKRLDVAALVLRTRDRNAAEDLVLDLIGRTDVRVEAMVESEYYAGIARALRPVQGVSIALTVLLGFGALLAGTNTLVTSVLGRTRELAVLMVLGYRRRAVLLTLLLESVLLCAAGGLIGVGGARLLDGLPMRVPMGAFRFVVDAQGLGLGLALAVLVGLFGAIVPLTRMARVPIVEALRTGGG